MGIIHRVHARPASRTHNASPPKTADAPPPNGTIAGSPPDAVKKSIRKQVADGIRRSPLASSSVLVMTAAYGGGGFAVDLMLNSYSFGAAVAAPAIPLAAAALGAVIALAIGRS